MSTIEKPIVVNLYAGPGTGKSTCAAQIFSELKWNGINAEMTPEFAKEKVWEGSLGVLDDQIYIFAKQLHKMRRLVGKVDVIVTDSPLLFSIMYDKSGNENLRNLVLDTYNEFVNFNVLLRRVKKYEPAGRVQSENEAKELDMLIEGILNKNNIRYLEFLGDKTNANKIANIITSLVNQKKKLNDK